MRHSYRERSSGLYGLIRRPMMDLEILNAVSGEWHLVEDVLVDTGADFSLMPQIVGNQVVGGISTGEPIRIKGVIPGLQLKVDIHHIRIRFDGYTIECPVAISGRNDVKPILGRTGAIA